MSLNLVIYYMSHESIGIVQRTEFEIKPALGSTTIETLRKVVLDNPSVSVGRSVTALL